MLSDINFPSLKPGEHASRSRVLVYGLILASVALTGCCTTSQPPAAPHFDKPNAVQPVTALQPAQVLVPTPPGDATTTVLVYADRARTLQGAELQQEISRLGEAASTPADQLRLAVALMQTRQLYDLVRAQDLLQRVLANSGDDARSLHPLARLLATRFAEQRRVEDQMDRQGQQLRDAQRRLEQTNDKLEALKEIERSLTTRPGAPATTSRSRTRPATP